MNPDDLEQTADSLGLDQSTIESRLAALELSPDQRLQLRNLWRDLESSSSSFIDQLYDRFFKTPTLAAILMSETRVQRLKDLQSKYLEQVFCNEIDRDYILSRLRIGQVHYRLKIKPQWYLATYSHFLVEYISKFLSTQEDFQFQIDHICSLIRTLFFDASLVLDAYGLHEESHYFAQAEQKQSQSEPSNSEPKAKPTIDSIDSKHTSRSMQRIRLTEDEALLRTSYIGLDEVDLIYLKSLSPIHDRCSRTILDQFYRFLRSSDVYSKLISDETAERLILQVTSYWRELFNGRFDRPYAASRMRIGVIHEHIGIEPQMYLSGLARQMTSFIQSIPANHPNLLQCLQAYVKAVVFDITFVIDAYMESRVDSLFRVESFAQQLIQGIDSCVVIVDSLGRIQYANHHFVALVGTDPSLLYRMELFDALPSKEIRQLLEQVADPKLTRLARSIKLGDTQYRVTVLRLDEQVGKKQQSRAVMIEDISKFVQLTDRLEEEDRELSFASQQIDAVIWSMDFRSETIHAISQQAIAVTGHRDLAFLGIPGAWFERIDINHLTAFRNACESATQRQACNIEYRFVRADNQWVWLRSMIQRHPDPKKSDYIVALTLDITRDKEGEAKRLDALRNIAGGIAHVVNNALTVVMGNMEILKQSDIPPESVLAVNQTLETSERTASVVEQLLQTAGAIRLSPRLCQLKDLLTRYRATLQDVVGSQIELRMRLNDSYLCNIDEQAFRLALERLCLNAKQAVPEGGLISIETREHSGLAETDGSLISNGPIVELLVTDNGVGMSGEVLSRALQPFFSTRHKAEALGLGLSSVDGFVRQSGGRLRIQSNSEQGTTILIQFPGFPNAESRVPHENLAPQVPKVVALYAGNVALSEVLHAILKHLGYSVREVGSFSAIQLETERAQIALVMLPDETLDLQRSALRSLQTSRSDLSVVLMVDDLEFARTNFSIPPHWRLIEKPFSLEQIAACLSELDRLP